MKINRPTDTRSLFCRGHIQDRASRAFTLTELLVVLVTLGILGMLLLPALGDSRTGTKTFQCLNNMRQMALAWTLYAGDNHDRLAINSDPHVRGTSVYPFPTGGPSWVTGSMDWTTGQYNTNGSWLVDDKRSLLGSYLGRSAKVFACPATAIFVSPSEQALGWSQRSRSVAMNAAVGEGDKYQEPSNPFGWTSWYMAIKSTDFHTPGPSAIWVFSDEHPDSIDDGLLYTASYAVTTLTELPGSQHEGACGVAFADGHSEIHKWQGPVVVQPVIYKQQTGPLPAGRQQVPCSISDPDMLWLAQHTPQN